MIVGYIVTNDGEPLGVSKDKRTLTGIGGKGAVACFPSCGAAQNAVNRTVTKFLRDQGWTKHFNRWIAPSSYSVRRLELDVPVAELISTEVAGAE